MIRVISSFADGPVKFNPTGPAEDQNQKLILSTGRRTVHQRGRKGTGKVMQLHGAQ